MSWGPALALFGCYAFPFVAGWTLLSEAIALRLLRFRESFSRCFGDAVIVNLVSGVIGIASLNFLTSSMSYMIWVNGLNGSPPLDDYQTIASGTLNLAIWLLLAVDWIGSILFESLALVLVLVWRPGAETVYVADVGESGARRPNWLAILGGVWIISAIINTVSYGGFLIALLIFRPF